MRFTKDIRFPATPEQTRAMLLDRGFREQVAREAGASSYDVTVDERADGTTRASVETAQPAGDLPSVARKFIGSELRIVQSETWTSADRADLDVAIPGAPGSIRGTIALRPDGEETVQTVDAEIKVKVPLIGGQVEKMIGSVLGSVLKLQQRVGREWLVP